MSILILPAYWLHNIYKGTLLYVVRRILLVHAFLQFKIPLGPGRCGTLRTRKHMDFGIANSSLNDQLYYLTANGLMPTEKQMLKVFEKSSRRGLVQRFT